MKLVLRLLSCAFLLGFLGLALLPTQTVEASTLPNAVPSNAQWGIYQWVSTGDFAYKGSTSLPVTVTEGSGGEYSTGILMGYSFSNPKTIDGFSVSSTTSNSDRSFVMEFYNQSGSLITSIDSKSSTSVIKGVSEIRFGYSGSTSVETTESFNSAYFGGTSPVDTKTTQALADLYGGSLTLSAPSVKTSFAGVKLTGQSQTIHATLSNWSITDSTGTGNGWNVQVQASQLTEIPPSGGFSSGTSALTLPQGSLSLSGVRTVTADTGSKPVSSTGGPIIQSVGSTIDTSSPVLLVKTNSNYGLGTYTVNEPTDSLSLTLSPSSTKVDSINYPSKPTPYQTTLTYTVTSGP